MDTALVLPASTSVSHIALRSAQSTWPCAQLPVSEQSRRPTFSPQIPLWGKILPGWEISQPLLVTLERETDGYCIVSDEQFAVYGDGDTPSRALQDYIVSLIDYYQILAARAETDPPTRVLFRRLASYLRPIG